MKNKLFYGRKGNPVLDSVLVLVTLASLSIVGFIMFAFYQDYNTSYQNDSSSSVVGKQQTQKMVTSYPKMIDGMFMFFLILIWIAVIFFSFQIDTHPIFFIISILLLIIVLFVAASLSNAQQDIASDPDFINASVQFPMTNFVMNHLVETIIVIAFSIVIALFMKSKSEGGL